LIDLAGTNIFKLQHSESVVDSVSFVLVCKKGINAIKDELTNTRVYPHSRRGRHSESHNVVR